MTRLIAPIAGGIKRMQIYMNHFKIGQFVTVGKDLGVIVGLPNENGIPEEHLAIWYGEKTDEGSPKARTVPQEYCVPVDQVFYYH